tara:strand:- start:1319 stop:2077 length:759 start_codon:yes stop_codon:yes gene_type:complete
MATVSNFLIVEHIHNLQKVNNVPYTSGLSKFDDPIKIGTGAGLTVQESGAVALGLNAGVSQGLECIAIGASAGTAQAEYSVAVGGQAGQSSAGFCVAVGFAAGADNQALNCTAVGSESGSLNAGANSTAVGANCGSVSMGLGAVGLGVNSLNSDAGLYAVGIGYSAAPVDAGDRTITINSSGLSQRNGGHNTVIINGSTAEIIPSGVDSIYMAPFFNATATAGSVKKPSDAGFTQYLVYNPTTKEVRVCNFD